MAIKSYPYCTTCKAWDKPLHINSTGNVSVTYMCRECRLAKQKSYYQRNKKKCREIIYKSIKKHQYKQDTRVELNKAIKRGEIKRPDACSECARTDKRIEGAHIDYSNPLNVRWLCTPCHRVYDKEVKKV